MLRYWQPPPDDKPSSGQAWEDLWVDRAREHRGTFLGMLYAQAVLSAWRYRDGETCWKWFQRIQALYIDGYFSYEAFVDLVERTLPPVVSSPFLPFDLPEAPHGLPDALPGIPLPVFVYKPGDEDDQLNKAYQDGIPSLLGQLTPLGDGVKCLVKGLTDLSNSELELRVTFELGRLQLFYDLNSCRHDLPDENEEPLWGLGQKKPKGCGDQIWKHDPSEMWEFTREPAKLPWVRTKRQ